MATQTAKKTAATAKDKAKRGRGSEMEMDFSKLTAAPAAPVQRAKQEASNPFLDQVKESAKLTGESDGDKGAFVFGPLPNERAVKQVQSLLSRAAEILDVGMTIAKPTQIAEGKDKGKWIVHWQAKPERIRRPRKDKDESKS